MLAGPKKKPPEGGFLPETRVARSGFLDGASNRSRSVRRGRSGCRSGIRDCDRACGSRCGTGGGLGRRCVGG